jgi:hypothetical protein
MSTVTERLSRTPYKVGGFAVLLAAVFGAALAVGTQVGPLDEPAEAHTAEHSEHGEHGEHAEQATEVPGGLMVSQSGYTLRLADAQLSAGRGRPLAFAVEGPDGRPVTAYDEQHEKDLHLIVVRRDHRGFQHVHPALDAQGTWHVPVDLTAGAWRVFADFKPAGADALTLGADLTVAGQSAATTPPPVTRTATVDGYTVTVTGDLVAGEHATLRLSVSEDGEPVTDLQPYLGAYGHLVALREGDLAYLHVHPEGPSEPGPVVAFVAEVPSAGRYHLYLDFRHGGVVRTAQLALDATAEPST